MREKTLFWDVDTQFDFMEPQGALSVPAAREILDKVSAIRRFARKDVVTPLDPQADDLLQYSRTTEPIEVVQGRLRKALSALPESIKDIRRPGQYPVEFVGFSV